MEKEKHDKMLSKIKVTPLAAESFGVRSMCTLVETPDVTVLLDAGISLCPYRFSLPPHPIEFQTIARLRKLIAETADKAEVVTISHYHFDHHTPSYEDWVVNWTEANETARQIYQDKTVLMKNPREKLMQAKGSARGFSKKQAENTLKNWKQPTEKHSFMGRRCCVFLSLLRMGLKIQCWAGLPWRLWSMRGSGSCLLLTFKDQCPLIRLS